MERVEKKEKCRKRRIGYKEEEVEREKERERERESWRDRKRVGKVF
jgi:hypothetical protein